MEQLKRWREARGLSQTKLAARADVNPATVNQIEGGKRAASPATLNKLAAALDISLYELLEGEPHPKAHGRSSLEPSFDDLNDVLEDLRHTTDRFEGYNAIQQAVDDFRKAWEKRLADGDFDKAAIEEAGGALAAFWPAVTAAADAEMAELARDGAESEEAAAQSVLLPAIARFQAFADRVNSIYREQFQDAPAAKVYPFPQRMPRAS